MKWFGESWGAAACEPSEHADIPIGQKCEYCEIEIRDGDEGVILPCSGAVAFYFIPYHLNCFLETLGIKTNVIK